MRTSITQNPAVPPDRRDLLFTCCWIVVFLLALYLRMSGLFRGLEPPGSIFHPDEPKQVLALVNFLKGNYLSYRGDLFYDGYPYGLNHLDEYILRPLLFFFNADIPDRIYFYYYARLLRVAYGMATVVLLYWFVARLVRDRTTALLAMLLFSLAPLSITVAHFATGDIGVDFFAALGFSCLLLYTDGILKKTWLFAGGAAVGAAFSAKYNGLLIGMVPGMLICFESWRKRDVRFLASRGLVLLSGTATGIILFTPNLLLDFGTSLKNMTANFQFIRNYHVPAEILAKPWLERALLGLRNNSLFIISSLGWAASLAGVIGIPLIGRPGAACLNPGKNGDCSRNLFILSLALFPLLAFLVSLSGKYVVQPFHFSYLLYPIIAAAGLLFFHLSGSGSRILRGCGCILIILIAVEFSRVSWRENFFWKLEDNIFYEQNIPASIFTAKSLHPDRTGKIRSLFLEPLNDSVFRNRASGADGPDPAFWNGLEVAPLPQIPNPVGKDWIFLNGPTFPRNDKVIFIHARNRGRTVKKYLVLPAGESWPALGFRSGSYATEASIDFGNTFAHLELDPHQQKTLLLEPEKWRISGRESPEGEGVYIIPLEISVPHDDLWLTILTTPKERQLFALFGGGQEAEPSVPAEMDRETKEELPGALSRIRYLETPTNQRIDAGRRLPVWEVVLPAGRYKLACEVNGLTDRPVIAIELEDAKGELHRLQKKTFSLRRGRQKIEYDFTKPFVPYQGRLVVSGITGAATLLKLTLFPDYLKIADDFEAWRISGGKPGWVSRFGGK